MSFFAPGTMKALDETARRNPARPQATLSEIHDAAWDLQQDQKSSFGLDNAIFEKYDEYRNEVQAFTGTRLSNPYNPGTSQGEEARERMFFEQVAKLQDGMEGSDLSEERFPVNSPEGIRRSVGEDRQAQRIEAGDVDARTQGFLANAASFLSTTAATLADPPMLMSMTVGLPFSSRVLVGALVDAGVGVVTEAGIQSGVQFGRQEVGEDPDLGEAALTVAGAGVGGFAFSALLRGGVKGAQHLLAKSRALPDHLRTSDVRAAEDYIQNHVDLEDANPFPDTEGGLKLHQDGMEAAMARLDPEGAEKSGIKVTQEARGEPVGEFDARIKETFPELFERATEVEGRMSDINARVREIDKELKTTPEVFAAAEEMATLRQELKATTDGRKTKRLKRKIAELEKKNGKAPERKAKAEKSKRTKLTNEKAKLKEELIPLRQELNALEARKGQAAKKVTPKQTKEKTARVKQAVGEAPAAERVVDFIKDFERALSQDAAKSLKSGPPVSRTGSPVSAHASSAATPEETADIKLKNDTAEAQVREAIEANPGLKMETVDADGNIKLMTGKQFLEDLEGDDVLFRELQDCIKKVAV